MMSLKASTVYMPAAVGDPLTRGPGRAFEDAAASAAAAAAAAVVNGNMRGGSFNVPTSVGVHPPGLVAERRERVLLRPWLENLIDSGTVPGLEWTDDAKTTFKVPWKHRSKKNWSLLHSCVFLEWAKNTGRWVEGDPEPNYAQLKTRLRCAFNKAPDIEEMKALHVMKCDEPYKVYRFTARRDGKTRPFARTFVTRASIPLANRRRRRRLHLPSSSNTAGSTAAPRPGTVKYEAVSTDCKSGSYFRGGEVAWKSEARLTEQALNRKYADLPDMSLVGPLAVDTKACLSDEDLKPIIPSVSRQPIRRILPEADAEFEFYQAPRTLTRFCSPQSAPVSHPPLVSAMPTMNERDAMASRLLVLQAASVVVEGSQRETKKNCMSDEEYYNNLVNGEPERAIQLSTPFVPRCADVQTRMSDPPSSLPAPSICARVDLCEKQSLMKSVPSSSSQSDQSSLSPVSSEPSESSLPPDRLPAPTKPPPARVSEDISAPRLHRLKRRYLQSQLLEQEQQHQLEEKEQREQNCDKTSSKYDEHLFSTFGQSACANNESPKMPVARALPVIAITDSIASLNFGKTFSPNGEVRETIYAEDRQSFDGYYSTEMDTASPPGSTYSTRCRMLEKRPSIGDEWHCNEMVRTGKPYRDMTTDSFAYGARYPTSAYPSREHLSNGDGSRVPATYYDEMRSPVECRDRIRDGDMYCERKLHQNVMNEALYANDHSANEMKPIVCYNEKFAMDCVRETRADVVDLTGRMDKIEGSDCSDVIDLSVKPADDVRRKIYDEHPTSSKHLYDRESKNVVCYASPGVQSDLEQLEASLRHRTELIASKSKALVSRERELEALEKQLAAREAQLYQERHVHASPEFERPPLTSSCNMRMLPLTGDSVQPRAMHMAAVQRAGCNEVSDGRYSGYGGDPVSRMNADVLKPKRARMMETFGNVSNGMMHRVNYQPPMFESNNVPAAPVYVHRRVSTAGSDTIPSPSSLTPPSAEPNWSQPLLSKHSGMSPPQVDGSLVSRKRGRPKGSKNRTKFDMAVSGVSSNIGMLHSPTSNATAMHRVASVNEIYERKLYDEDLHLSPEDIRGPSYDDRLNMPMESTIKRSPIFSGGQVFTSETDKMRTSEYPSYVSASMPATVRQLVKSAAGTTGGSILPPLSPTMDSGDVNVSRHAHRMTAGTVGYVCNSRYNESKYPRDGIGAASACSQLQMRFGGPVDVMATECPAGGEKVRDPMNYKPSAYQQGHAGTKGETLMTVCDRGPYVGNDGRILALDSSGTWNAEYFNRALRGRRQESSDSASNDFVGCGQLVINLEAE